MLATRNQHNLLFSNTQHKVCAGSFGAFAARSFEVYAESGCPMRMRKHAEQTNAAAARV